MSRLRLFRRCGSGLRVSPTFSSLGDKVSNVNAVGLVPYDETVVACKSWSTLQTWPAQCLAVCRTVNIHAQFLAVCSPSALVPFNVMR